MLQELGKTILLITASLFPIINPPASALIVLSMVPDATPKQLDLLARKIAINSFVMLLASLSIGAYVLNLFGISIPVLRVAGGLVIAMAGWGLLHANTSFVRRAAKGGEVADMHANGESFTRNAFYPLTLPVTVGPGAISVAIALGTGSPRAGLQPVHLIGAGIGLALLCASIYLCTRFAGHARQLLGPNGMQIAMRLFAFAIFCIGVQILWLGLSELLTAARFV